MLAEQARKMKGGNNLAVFCWCCCHFFELQKNNLRTEKHSRLILHTLQSRWILPTFDCAYQLENKNNTETPKKWEKVHPTLGSWCKRTDSGTWIPMHINVSLVSVYTYGVQARFSFYLSFSSDAKPFSRFVSSFPGTKLFIRFPPLKPFWPWHIVNSCE